MAKKKAVKKTNVKKTTAKLESQIDVINSEVIAAALSSANTPVILKVCRLCEAKDGPFLNIFEADKMTAKKIETVMPFGIAENDDLPHKICFRCSAKLEELYEFIQKCIKTQENLLTTYGNRRTVGKTKDRELWEEKLNQSNKTNDDICEELIKKAMEGIKDIPIKPPPMTDGKASVVKKVNKKLPTKTNNGEKEDEENNEGKEDNINVKNNNNTTCISKDDEPISVLKNAKKSYEYDDNYEPPAKRMTRLSYENKVAVNKNIPNNNVDRKDISEPNKKDEAISINAEPDKKDLTIRQSLQINNFSLEEPTKPELPKEPESKPFDIMDHVSMIKVNKVGVLFQCKLCNRNFLKKEVVLSHACAKQGGVKVQNTKVFVPPVPPKIQQTVKYITMNKDKDTCKPSISSDKSKINIENKKPIACSEPINLDDDDDDKPLTVAKPAKPKIGPASKVRRTDTTSKSLLINTSNENVSLVPNESPITPSITATITSATLVPSVQFPNAPSLNSRYKLMPGPKNSFTLVEDKSTPVTKPVEQQTITVPFTLTESRTSDAKIHKSQNSIVRKHENFVPIAPKPSKRSISRPYPVGLISAAGSRAPAATGPTVAFSTPAMKKQSYTVVQTGNPSKLLISTKPQPPPPAEDLSNRKSRKFKHVEKKDDTNKQPFSITIEDTTPVTDPAIFTFINVDPLLQPSYVLPTDNTIQESQISTSTNGTKKADHNKYMCNMCNEKFSREKKLLAHIRSHYTQMDEEDRKRASTSSRKRGRQ